MSFIASSKLKTNACSADMHHVNKYIHVNRTLNMCIQHTYAQNYLNVDCDRDFTIGNFIFHENRFYFV